ncbi:MAG: heme-copper oxidase subunit III [Bacteroidia bacterium]
MENKLNFGTGVSHQRYIIHPYKFNLWLFLLTSTMVFGGLTSAYLVSRAGVEKPMFFALPDIVKVNTVLLLFSSVSMQFSTWSIKKEEQGKALFGLLITFLLGVAFLIGQFNAWNELTAAKLPFVDNARLDKSVSFFYIFTGLHGLHIIGSVLAVLYTLIKTANDSFKPKNKILTFEIVGTFWHFLGLLWLYLYFFLIYTQSK